MRQTQAKTLKPMRDIVALLNSGATTDRVSDYPFRSPSEVSVYLAGLEQQMRTITTAALVKIPVPPPATPAKNYVDCKPVPNIQDDVDRLWRLADDAQNRLDILTSLEVSVSYNFREQRTGLLREIEQVRSRVLRERNRFLKSSAEMWKHAPAAAQEVVHGLCNAARAAFDGYTLTPVDELSCVVPFWRKDGTPGLRFCTYICATDFSTKRDRNDGFVYPTYYVLLSAIVCDGNRLSFAVNTLHDFKLPTTGNLGDSFLTLEEGTSLLNGLFEDDNVAAKCGLPINQPRSQIRIKRFSVGKHLQKVIVDKKANRLVFVLRPELNPEHVPAIAAQLVKDTHSILQPAPDSNLVYDIKETVPRQIHFRLSPASRAPSHKLTDEQHKILSDQFGMGHTEREAVQRILYGRQ